MQMLSIVRLRSFWIWRYYIIPNLCKIRKKVKGLLWASLNLSLLQTFGVLFGLGIIESLKNMEKWREWSSRNHFLCYLYSNNKRNFLLYFHFLSQIRYFVIFFWSSLHFLETLFDLLALDFRIIPKKTFKTQKIQKTKGEIQDDSNKLWMKTLNQEMNKETVNH